MGTNAGAELLVEIDRDARRPLRAQLEDGLREAVRSGRLAADARLPPSRALAADLGLSRRVVVDAYARLRAGGYLRAKPGAGTFVAGSAAQPERPAAEPPGRALRFHFFPRYPDLARLPPPILLREVQ